ncbi:hypothetical protein BG006_001475 [Podila minutissima]|uniref:Uncharacterized protein n=1 Tax=Podila minutissima TaxID=64525 RepID=A0A9P5SCE9_9FUNG|nr:hypothetical protein BG006_001475 [Podila minutissima]
MVRAGADMIFSIQFDDYHTDDPKSKLATFLGRPETADINSTSAVVQHWTGRSKFTGLDPSTKAFKWLKETYLQIEL